MKFRKEKSKSFSQSIILLILIFSILVYLADGKNIDTLTQLPTTEPEYLSPALSLPEALERIVVVYPGSHLVNIDSTRSVNVLAFETFWHTNSDADTVKSYLKEMYVKDHWRLGDSENSAKMTIEKDNVEGIIFINTYSDITEIKQVIFLKQH